MDIEEYLFIMERLNTPVDIKLLHERLGLPEDMLYNMLARKIVRKVLKTFHIIKAKQKTLLRNWKAGNSFIEIAKDIDFPPVLTAGFILEELGYGKKRFQDALRKPEALSDPRLRRELDEVSKNDFVYSPHAGEMQRAHGVAAEEELLKWVKGQNVPFLTENDSKRIKFHRRTPDFLLRKPIKVSGMVVNWVESKASFGSPEEMKRDYRRQLSDYVKYFGPGMVVYWYGFVDGVPLDPKVLVVDEEFFIS